MYLNDINVGNCFLRHVALNNIHKNKGNSDPFTRYEYNTDVSKIQTNLYVPTRYSDIDSYFWNSLELDLNGSFKDKYTNKSTESVMYPASLIKLPTISGDNVNLDFSIKHNNGFLDVSDNEFLAFSAPVDKNMFLIKSKQYHYQIPKSLSYNYEFTNSIPTQSTQENSNMILFFKSLIVQNISDVIVICSDFEVNETQNDKKDHFSGQAHSLDDAKVLLKCSPYWLVDITIKNQKKEIITVKSEKDKNLETNLYRIYNMVIQVTDVSDSSVKTYPIRIIILNNWPDHQKLPEELIDPFIGLLEHIYTQLNPVMETENKKKIAIHCSAGVGRTGTTILLYQIYSQMKKLINSHSTNDKSIDNITFYDMVTKYNPSPNNEYLLHVMMNESGLPLYFNNSEEQTGETKNMEDHITTIENLMNSKMTRYLFDNLFYFRSFRTLFVQKPEQFVSFYDFIAKMTIEKIKKMTWSSTHPKNTSVLSQKASNHIGLKVNIDKKKIVLV